MLGQRRRVVGKICEDEAAIALHIRNPLHVVLRIGDVEIGRIAFRVRHRGERAIRAENPRVIGATEGAVGALIDHTEARAAVRTAVVKDVDVAVVMPRHQHFEFGKAGADEIAGILQLALVRDIDPKPAEDALLFERKDCRIGIGAPVHMIRLHEPAYLLRRDRKVDALRFANDLVVHALRSRLISRWPDPNANIIRF
jgi:hypothetical protein